MFIRSTTLAVVTLSMTSLCGAVQQAEAAYKCALPAITDTVKRAVCATPALKTLDETETARLGELKIVLNKNAYALTDADRRLFVKARGTCKADARCLEATYNAQIRLYGTLLGCKAGPRQTDCARRSIAAHREALHRSQ